MTRCHRAPLTRKASSPGARQAKARLRLTLAAALVAGPFTLVAGTSPAAEGKSWQVARGDVRVVCPMTVGGSFEAKTTSLTGTLSLSSAHPVTFAGELSVDLSTLDTGISLRNHHLRDNYLEVPRGEGFDRAVLSDIRLGDVDPETFQGKTGFSGTFRLHGVKKALAGQAEIHRDGRTVRVDASFPVSVSDFGIAKPQYLGVGVTNEVRVIVSLVAEPSSGPEAAR